MNKFIAVAMRHSPGNEEFYTSIRPTSTTVALRKPLISEVNTRNPTSQAITSGLGLKLDDGTTSRMSGHMENIRNPSPNGTHYRCPADLESEPRKARELEKSTCRNSARPNEYL